MTPVKKIIYEKIEKNITTLPDKDVFNFLPRPLWRIVQRTINDLKRKYNKMT
jgi:hypothetical protein